MKQRYLKVQSAIDANFAHWVLDRYTLLHNQPATPPVMVHHIARHLARVVEQKHEKVALVVMDGMALDQWLVLRDELRGQLPELTIQEEAAFAWAPSLTPVSRQAIFAGKHPHVFASSLATTDREASLWGQFWQERGLSPDEVGYKKSLGEGTVAEIQAMLSHPKLRVAGLVVDKVDKIMHGMTLGTAGMYSQIRQWAREGYLQALLDCLLVLGFTIYVTADHGNIEAVGCGRPANDGILADVRGERVRVYPDPTLRANSASQFPDAVAWPPIGSAYFPLFAPGRAAFVKKHERIVGHGGVCLEELIVPWIRIARSTL